MLTKHLNIIADLKKQTVKFNIISLLIITFLFSFFTAIRLKKDHLLMIAANANRLHLKPIKRKSDLPERWCSRQIFNLRKARSLFCSFNSNIRFLIFHEFSFYVLREMCRHFYLFSSSVCLHRSWSFSGLSIIFYA